MNRSTCAKPNARTPRTTKSAAHQSRLQISRAAKIMCGHVTKLHYDLGRSGTPIHASPADHKAAELDCCWTEHQCEHPMETRRSRSSRIEHTNHPPNRRRSSGSTRDHVRIFIPHFRRPLVPGFRRRWQGHLLKPRLTNRLTPHLRTKSKNIRRKERWNQEHASHVKENQRKRKIHPYSHHVRTKKRGNRMHAGASLEQPVP